ncbi:glycosyltransferase family 2 protein, partial [Microgenomates group bacterium]|nr:glycosyltransferase family 2 protein [Microgenomates group bacterium]
SLTKNQGKGAAIRAGIKQATGAYVLIQDADLEYDPADIQSLLDPILNKKAEVIYGSRFLGPHKNMLFWHLMGNKFLSFITNFLYNTTLSDMEVGYKLIPKKLLDSITLKENRFGFEPEITSKILKQGIRIYEVPISYSGREFSEGKKITWVDGLIAFFLLFKYRFLD